MDHEPRVTRRLRSDAAENQERVLAAAATVFVRDGYAVPLAAVANEAGVGIGTLYRHYANRDALLDALQVRAYQIVLATIVEIEALGQSGLRSVELFLERTIVHRGQLVLPFHGSPDSQSPAVTASATEVGDAMRAMLSRGQVDRTVRDGVRPIDVIVFGSMIARPLPAVRHWDAIAQAQIRIFLDGISATPRHEQSR